MKCYPSRLHHRTPPWVETKATFHIRISIAREADLALTESSIAIPLLNLAQFYQEQSRWHCRLMLLMRDHFHALLIFPHDRAMGSVIAAWKGYQTKHLGITWQSNFFDHRIRHRDELRETENYIRHNPVRKGLCVDPDAWPWVISCVD